MKKICLFRRYMLLCLGLLIMAFGVAFSIKAGLGTSPISSLPYVISLLTPMTVGTATIAMHCVLILLQILLLRREFPVYQLLQLPTAFLFGYLTDFAVWVIDPLKVSSYPESWVFCIIGIILVGAGVSLEVNAAVVTLAGEGMVLAVSKVFHFPFANSKIGFDCTLVIIASVLSLVFLGTLEGVREGTAAAALLVGIVARQAGRLFAVRLAKAAAGECSQNSI